MTRARFSPAASRLCSGARPSASRLSRDATFPPISAISARSPPSAPPLHLSRLSPLPFPPQETSERVQQRRSSQERVQDPQARLGRARPTRELFAGAPLPRRRPRLGIASASSAVPTPPTTRTPTPRPPDRPVLAPRGSLTAARACARARAPAAPSPRERSASCFAPRRPPSTMSAARMRRAARMAQSAPPPPPLWARATARPASRVVPRVRAVPWTARHPAAAARASARTRLARLASPESTPRRISASSRRTRTRTPGRTTARSRSTSPPTRTA